MRMNQVRQILMNELSLTREGVRSEVENIVKKEVEKHLSRLDKVEFVERIIAEEIGRLAAGKAMFGQRNLANIVQDVVKSELSNFIGRRVKISVESEAPVEAPPEVAAP